MKKMISIICTIIIISTLLMGVMHLPNFGNKDLLDKRPVATKYLKDGVKDTGAKNIVTAVILDYRAFDTFVEATVLFTGILCVIMILKKGDEELDE